MITALLDLYEASLEIEWLKWAVQLQEKMNSLFWDSKNGGYFSVSEGDKNLVLRLREDYDGAEPSPNSVSALNLLRLSQMVGESKYREMGMKTMMSFSRLLQEATIAIPQMGVALDFHLSKKMQIVIAGKNSDAGVQELLQTVHKHFIPNKIILLADQAEGQQYLAQKLEFLKDLKMQGNKATVYVCENFTCQLPLTSSSDLDALLSKSITK